jgi:hypothetical protein
MIGGLAACAGRPPSTEGLVLLTRDGCVNTETLRANLDEALASFPQPPTYEVIDLDAVAASDVRRGYPTPTLLYASRDVFGMPAPQPPLPEPT